MASLYNYISPVRGGGSRQLSDLVGRRMNKGYVRNPKANPIGATQSLSKKVPDDFGVYLLAFPGTYKPYSVIETIKRTLAKMNIKMPRFIGKPNLGIRKVPEGTNVIAIVSGKNGVEPPPGASFACKYEFQQPIRTLEMGTQEAHIAVKPIIGEIINALRLKKNS